MRHITPQRLDPFDVRDLSQCQEVFDELLVRGGIAKDSEEAARIATILVELYRQGVRDRAHLASMVTAARGLFASGPATDASAPMSETI
ncbi:hypothetical protein [Rhizobium hainanense]|uniref:Uncharacterized protein n=1 Tax=Rhizobium hainanense TaxID=52131 RepID=A0A1C3WCJ1_9HYPH|nr:hypothetical protein [Rhizobium hainanense]SCB37558.1 hypothetical protein GA0061100_11537 [Rhizobium hainanense]